jgi:hypothetical protein
MIAPPRFIESVLSALGATPEYRDLVIGDLAEEMVLRARYDGEPAARRWYWREALRSIPHLLGNGLREAGYRGIGHLLGLVLTAWTFVAVICGMTFVIVFRTVVTFWPDFRQIVHGGQGYATFVILGVSMTAFIGGLIAATLNKRAPLTGAVALGVTWAATELTLIAIGRVAPAPFWFPIVVPTLMLSAAVAGGLFHLRRQLLTK